MNAIASERHLKDSKGSGRNTFVALFVCAALLLSCKERGDPTSPEGAAMLSPEPSSAETFGPSGSHVYGLQIGGDCPVAICGKCNDGYHWQVNSGSALNANSIATYQCSTHGGVLIWCCPCSPTCLSPQEAPSSP